MKEGFNRADYLALPEVQGFTKYLAGLIKDQNNFSHKYVNRRSKRVFSFSSLDDALNQYSWPEGKNDYKKTELVLADLRSQLRLSLAQRDEAMALAACLSVFRWGGVYAHNGPWLINYASTHSVLELLEIASSELTSETVNTKLFSRDQLRMNAAFTKVYSLIIDDFLIYDSRVAAALCMIIVRYLEAEGHQALPVALNLYTMPAKEGPNAASPKNRDPNTKRFVFSKMHAREDCHALSNVKANILVSEALGVDGFAGYPRSSSVRAVEAALFMVGYDLGLR